MTVVFPGSFDPVTLGHLDIIKRGAWLFEKVIVAVLNNPSKNPMFTLQERVTILKEVLKNIPNAHVEAYDGLLVEFAKQHRANCILRGVRSEADCAYELPRAQANSKLSDGLETIMLVTDPTYTYISASLVREAALASGFDREILAQWVPSTVMDAIYLKAEI